MRPSTCLRICKTASQHAESVSKMPLSAVDSAAAQLLPPLILYRRLLRTHRKLDPEMRKIGDDYVKSEFRLHRGIDNPLHIVGFLGQWKLYLDHVDSAHGAGVAPGRKLLSDTLEKLSPEQVGQLYELLQATKEVYAADGNVHGEVLEESQDAKS